LVCTENIDEATYGIIHIAQIIFIGKMQRKNVVLNYWKELKLSRVLFEAYDII